MKNINSALRKTKVLKYLFLLSGIFVLFLVFWVSHEKEKEVVAEEIEVNEVNKNRHIPKEFDFNINNSILEGLNKNNLPYTIKAKVITKQNDNIYNLSTIDAIHKLSEDNLHIVADNGLLDETTNLLVLSENVKIVLNNFELTSNKVNFNLNSNLASSEDPVEVTYQNSTVTALNFYSDDSNNIINFEGKVVSTFNANDF
jgi:LPS export ABC transporter protein LptC